MRRIALCSCIILGPVQPAGAAPKPGPRNGPLTLSIELDRKKYTPGDTVKLKVVLKNVGDGPLYVTGNHLFPEGLEVGPGRYFELRIADRDGTRFHYWGEVMSEGRTYWRVVRLEAGQTFTHEVRLSAGSYAAVTTDKRHRLGTDAKKYQVSLVYTPPEGAGGVQTAPRGYEDKLRWRGKLVSNVVELLFD